MKRLAQLSALLLSVGITSTFASTFTTTSPTGGALPTGISSVGGIVTDITGINGARIVSQVAASSEFQGNSSYNVPALLFGTQNGFNASLVNLLGGGIVTASFRITLFDGDSAAGNFDYNQNTLLVNGINFGNFSSVATQQTDGTGHIVYGSGHGFGDNILDTGFFSSTDGGLLSQLFASLSTGKIEFKLNDQTPGDQFFDFQQGVSASALNTASAPIVAAAVPEPASLALLAIGTVGFVRLRRRSTRG